VFRDRLTGSCPCDMINVLMDQKVAVNNKENEMRKLYALGLSAAMLMAAAEQSAAAGSTEALATEATAKKSIVPAKYAGKYKGAGDSVSEFINTQSSGKEGFEFPAFFSLCRKNGIAEDKVKHYEDQVLVEKRNGSPGRARMTLGNMLRSIARNKGQLIGLNDEATTFADLKKPAVSGAAAAAQETAETKEEVASGATESAADETTE